MGNIIEDRKEESYTNHLSLVTKENIECILLKSITITKRFLVLQFLRLY